VYGEIGSKQAIATQRSQTGLLYKTRTWYSWVFRKQTLSRI